MYDVILKEEKTPNLQNNFDLVTISLRLLRALKTGAVVEKRLSYTGLFGICWRRWDNFNPNRHSDIQVTNNTYAASQLFQQRQGTTRKEREREPIRQREKEFAKLGSGVERFKKFQPTKLEFCCVNSWGVISCQFKFTRV